MERGVSGTKWNKLTTNLTYVRICVSLVNAKAAALDKKIPLYQHISDLNGTAGQYLMPVPMMNIINGGEHADNNVDIQEFMIQPVGAKNFRLVPIFMTARNKRIRSISKHVTCSFITVR